MPACNTSPTVPGSDSAARWERSVRATTISRFRPWPRFSTPRPRETFELAPDDVVVTIHCGSRGLGHQIGTEFLKEMLLAAKASGIELIDRELACAPINSEVGERYLGAMRAAINCALANREILGHYARRVFAHFFPSCDLRLLFDVSHNTCKVEIHAVDGKHARAVRSPQGRHEGLWARSCKPARGIARGWPAGADRRQHGYRLLYSGRRSDR